MDVYSLILSFKYVAIFIGTLFEGPTVILLVGLFSRLEYINPYLGFSIHIIADMAADTVYYAIGFFGGTRVLPKIAKYLKFSVKEIEAIEEKFKKHSVKLIFFGQITQVLGFPILIAASLVRYPFYKLFLLDLLATAIKAIVLFSVGYYFGGFWKTADNAILIASTIAIVFIIFQLSFFLLRRLVKIKNGTIVFDKKEEERLLKKWKKRK